MNLTPEKKNRQLAQLTERKLKAKKLVTKLATQINALIATATAPSVSRGRQVPCVDLESFGPVNWDKFVKFLYGNDSYRYPIEEWTAEVQSAMSELRAMHRFIVEARIRGLTQARTAELVGWASSTRVGQIQPHAFRRIAFHPALNGKRKAFEAAFFCEWYETGDEATSTFTGLNGKLVPYQYRIERCRVCGRRGEDKQSPLCPQKDTVTIQTMLDIDSLSAKQSSVSIP